MEAGGGVGGGVGGLGLSERERGSVFKQMGEMKKKIQVMIGHSSFYEGGRDGTMPLRLRAVNNYLGYLF